MSVLAGAESPWYKGFITGPSSFATDAALDWSWFTNRGVRRILLHTGAVCAVAEVSEKQATDAGAAVAAGAGSSGYPVFSFFLETPHYVNTDANDLYFAATSQPEQSAPPAPEGTGEEDIDYTYPPLPATAESPDWLHAAAGSASAAVAATADYDNRNTDPYATSDGNNEPFLSARDFSDVSIPAKVVAFLVVFVFMSVTIVINSEVSQAIGQTKGMSWLNVLWWVLLLSPIVSLIIFNIMRLVVNAIVSVPSDESRVTELSLFATVWVAIFVIATCTPYAWAHGQLAAANRLTETGKAVSYHCWNNAANTSKTMSQSVTEFILLEEPQWEVQRSATSQKVSFISDDDDATKYTYCVAPIVYKGAVNCSYVNLFAICFRSLSGVGSCSDADAVACGWNLPPNGVAQRVMNKNEQFFQVAETDDDYDAFQTAFNRAAAGKPGAVNIPVLYGGVSPAEIDDLEPGYELLTNQLRGVIYGIHFSVSFLLALAYVLGARHFFSVFAIFCVCLECMDDLCC